MGTKRQKKNLRFIASCSAKKIYVFVRMRWKNNRLMKEKTEEICWLLGNFSFKRVFQHFYLC